MQYRQSVFCPSTHSITLTLPFKYIENFTSKNWKFSDKKTLIFFIFLLIDCRYSLEPPRRGGSNEYPQSMFLSRNKKNNVYPRKPQFYYIKVGQNYIGMFSWWFIWLVLVFVNFLPSRDSNNSVNVFTMTYFHGLTTYAFSHLPDVLLT